MNQQRELLGEDFVYPGHPVPIALCIARSFQSYETALYREKGSYPAALGSRAIPGTSLAAYLAVELLEKLHAGYEWDLAMTWADLVWAASIEEKSAGDTLLQLGLAQARRTAPLLRELSSWWSA